MAAVGNADDDVGWRRIERGVGDIHLLRVSLCSLNRQEKTPSSTGGGEEIAFAKGMEPQRGCDSQLVEIDFLTS